VSNTILTISMITRESLRVLENNLTFTKNVNRNYDNKFAQSGAKIGTTVNVRKPVRYTVSSGPALSVQDVTETQVPVVLDQQKHVDFEFTSVDMTMSIDDFSERYIKPAVAALANQVDKDGLALYNQIYQLVGTPGTVPNALLTYLLAGVELDNSAAPADDTRFICITPKMQATIVDALKGLFQASSNIAEQYRKGKMGEAIGFSWFMDQNIATHTVGPLGGAPLVNGAAQVGASLITDGWTAAAASRLKKGDIFTLPTVFAVNPQSRQSTGDLQKFVVTSDFSSDGAGAGSIGISPSIVVSGAYQTVTNSPADNAALTIVTGSASTAYPQGIAAHRDAFVFATADLQMPNGTDMADRVASRKLGLSLRLVRDYDITTDKFPTRVDVLYGWSVLRPELACRVTS
jgi:hypothetical protein